MKQDKEKYFEPLIDQIRVVRRKRNLVAVIKKNLAAYHFLPADVQVLLNNPEEHLDTTTTSKLFLFGEQIWLQSKSEKIDPELFFTETEIKKARQWSGKIERTKDVEFPLVLDGVFNYLGRNRWGGYISAKMIKKLMDAMLIEYNYDVQREPEKVIVDGEVKYRPKVNKQNVREIKQHLKEGSLEPTQIVLNASVGTADDNMNEIEFNEKEHKIIINKGTILDIVDGFHRCSGTQLALDDNPDIEFRFPLLITNYTVDEAQQYQAQFAKQEQISTARAKEMTKETYADEIVATLKNNSELKGRIALGGDVRSKFDEIVSYDTLVKAIDDSFIIENRAKSRDIAKYLTEYFDYLIGFNEDIFNKRTYKGKNDSLMNSPDMFYGYVQLAARMKEEEIEASEVTSYIKKIDFSRDNPKWIEYEVLDSDKNMNKRSDIKIKGIVRMFEDMEF